MGTKFIKEVTISAPSTPAEIANSIFDSYSEDEPQTAVFQQELIIACADLVFIFFFNIKFFRYLKNLNLLMAF